MTSQVNRQLALEEESIGLGVARYYETMRIAEEKTTPGKELIRMMIPPLAESIAEWSRPYQEGRSGPAAGLAMFIEQFSAEDVAFIVSRHVLRAFSGDRKLTHNALEIARQLEEASMSDTLRRQDEKAFKRMQTKAEKTPFPNKRYILVKKAMDKASIRRIAWGRSERTRLGAQLIAMCADATGMFSIQNRAEGKRMYAYMVPNDDTLSNLDMAHQRCSLHAPVYLPMVAPPTPWKGVRGGGYFKLRLRLLNARRVNAGYMEELRNKDMPMVYGAINAIQATPWRINKGVLAVMKEAWDSGSLLGGLPAQEDKPVPAAPWGEGPAPDRDDPVAKAHYAQKARVLDANERVVSKRLSMNSKLWVGEKFADEAAIYFPHVLDWRGRIYPVPVHVNPQADDTGKALLEFAEGVELGEEGAFWLAVHGANCFGVDKVSFDERVQWIERHAAEFLDSAYAPFDGRRFWTEADDPYMALAFCQEWAALTRWVEADNPQETFVSHLPVAWDGSCNGLQNFSAMLRDPVGGAATNLVPQETPADIYQRVADVANEQVEKDVRSGKDVNAVYWRGKVTRKIAKRPTMTLPYGSGRFGFRSQLVQELEKIKADEGTPYLQGDEFLCAMYMANVLHDALGKVVVAAREAMDWLKEASRLAAATDLPVWWTTPAGFPVMQDYREMIAQDVELYFGGSRRKLRLQIDGDKLDKRKQAQGISPNFVHSLDAAHLMRTVALGATEGITSWAMVHDSYGSHAGRAGDLQRILRAAFVEQYDANVLEDFRQQLLEQLRPEDREKLPPVPAMGSLDLSAVNASEYFFA